MERDEIEEFSIDACEVKQTIQLGDYVKDDSGDLMRPTER
jgi:hypothetical protein